MDVNAIGNNVNSIKVYNTGTELSQQTNTAVKDNSETLSINQIEKNQGSQSKQESKDGLDPKELDKAVKKLNKFLEDDKTHAQYSVHKDLGTLMIKIIDDVTDKVILELPPEKILDMVASMCKQVGLLDKKA